MAGAAITEGERRDDEAVFRSQKGGALVPSQVWRIVRAAAKRAGISGHVSPHWFRHSHASHALERGASVALVRDTLGHSSLAVTSMYTHARPTESSALHLAI
ncbi:MAG: tyrosine-type recombinase/integrase [Caldilineaceae bacterium]|nr:tyrosine-type recombinase/integrase [Caldilineaceae bacterium]